MPFAAVEDWTPSDVRRFLLSDEMTRSYVTLFEDDDGRTMLSYSLDYLHDKTQDLPAALHIHIAVHRLKNLLPPVTPTSENRGKRAGFRKGFQTLECY